MALRLLTSDPLHVDPALVGSALASPGRRIVAFGVDLVVLLVPTLAVIVAAAVLALDSSDPAALAAIRSLVSMPRSDPAARRAVTDAAITDLAPLLVRTEARGLPASVAAAVEEGDVRRAGDLLKGYEIWFALNFEESGGERPLQPRTIVVPIQKLIPAAVRALALLGVPALYFVALTRSRRGATVGKRLLRIRVVRLDGERLSWLESLERFIGYVHIPATMFLGLADLWRDPNRRMPHDRVVHTAVFRTHPARRRDGRGRPRSSSRRRSSSLPDTSLPASAPGSSRVVRSRGCRRDRPRACTRCSAH
jgi:hypothetical protein